MHPIFVFEVAQGIDLDRAEQLLAGAERPTFRHRGRATALFQYRPAPLRISQERTPLALGAWQSDPVVDLVLYDFGAASVAYHVAVAGDLDDLLTASRTLAQDDALRRDARSRVEALLHSIPAAATKPRVAGFTEDYAIFGLRTLPPGVTVSEFCDRNAATIAQILRADGGDLSEDEIANATELRISFGPSDLTIVDWDGAFVVDPDPEDVRAVLEFANVQLLEMRWLDLQMDHAIERSYQVLGRRWGWRIFWPRGVNDDVRQVAELQLESAVLLERVSNALKVFGEEYLARIYRLAAKRFQLAELDATISRKLATIESIYQKLSDHAATIRLEALEWIVIALIAAEIVLGLLH
ncbi:MAG TPA: hypothetical protein VFJ02_05395 [Vicinamibacterales bacterium]|nr:hypothetical protein [Vicinamibacterales bacterium]